MTEVIKFLTQNDEEAIVEAIQRAEKNTSGEIRVHIEKETSVATLERAMEVFHSLNMSATKDRNGVLIYVAVDSKKFAIYGDEGINEKVGADFWNSTKDIMQNHFKKGNNKQAFIDGIKEAGTQLKKYFPFQQDDTDELSNEISKG
jgi:uncharacterized membrane protein